MKLLTHIKPRASGTVTLKGDDGAELVFIPDDQGLLVCDVTHEPTVARLLTMENFEPYDEADYDAAIALAQSAAPDDEGVDGVDDLEDDIPADLNALPLEANTPTKPAPIPNKRGAKAKAQ
jgi:hypothetical protein